jgi:uncharacterized tellurite resistance protein B-like protein
MAMEEQLSLLTELIKLARIDKYLREEEYRFLYRISEMLQISKEDFNMLFEKYAEFLPPPFESDRILQFQRMVLLANVDLQVESEEVDFLKIAGIRLGLSPYAVDCVLEEMKRNEYGMIPPERLIRIFQIYHN